VAPNGNGIVATPGRAHDDVVIQRSSCHPVEYAIMLLVERDREWHTVPIFDNGHDSAEHHEHRFIGSEKQEPIITRGSVNDAMYRELAHA
jgi:hypothetical protein